MAGCSHKCKACRAKAADLACKLKSLSAENARLTAEVVERNAMLAELGKSLEASEAEVARYKALCLSHRPNRPEHVSSLQQQLVFEQVVAASGMSLAANDAAEGAAGSAGEAGAGGVDASGSHDVPGTNGAPPASARPPGGNGRGKDNRHNHGRRQLDLSTLPVQTVVVDPPEVLAADGKGFRLVSAETSNRLAFNPASYVRLCIVRRTYCEQPSETADLSETAEVSETVDAAETTDASPTAADWADAERRFSSVFVTAPVPDAVWARVFADPSAVAHTVIAKYDDILPLNRQEKISRREGCHLPRSTQCGWISLAYPVMKPIVDAMFTEAKASAFCIATDATGVPVREKPLGTEDGLPDGKPPMTEKGPCSKWHLFTFIADKEHIVFRHSKTHDSNALREMLSGYRGYLLGDATSIYSPLVRDALVVLVCCWAHVRRYFYRALESEPTRAMEAISIIGRLFAVERAVAHIPMPERTSRRAALALPILELFEAWVARHKTEVDPKSPLHKALVYAENQRGELRRFLEDGRLRIDNNVSEGSLRNSVLGRNAWQYFRNETGVEWYTVCRSLIASCKLHDICPARYLECVLRLAPHWPAARMLELSPKYWRATAEGLSPQQLSIVSPRWSSAFDAFRAPVDAPASVASAA